MKEILFEKAEFGYRSKPGASHEHIEVWLIELRRVYEKTPLRYRIEIRYRKGKKIFRYHNDINRIGRGYNDDRAWSLGSAKYHGSLILEWSREQRFRRRWFGPRVK